MTAVLALTWLTAGALGGHLLSYLGDGFNFRHILGAMVGPLALLLAVHERIWPD